MKQTEPYSAPKIQIIGPLATLTQTRWKQFHASDGLSYAGITIGNASV
jgi:hypothetical protein